MQKPKKILAVILSFVMLFCVLPVNALAADETYPTIKVDEVINLSFDENNRYYQYAFTPTESGFYSFYSFDNGDEEDHLDTYGEIYDSEWNLLLSNDDFYDYNNFNVSFPLSENKTYYLVATTYQYNEHNNFENGNCSVTVAKSTAEILPITLNAPSSKTIAGEGLIYLSFTPSETAIYEIAHIYNNDVYLDLRNPFDTSGNHIDYIYWNSNNTDTINQGFSQYKLQKDITYYFETHYEGKGSFAVNISTPAKATSISLENSSVNGFVGLEYSNCANFGPLGCAYEPTTWSIDDESIAQIVNYGDDLGGRALYIKMLKAGTAVITATSESGLTTTFPITAKEPKEAFVDNAITDTLSYEENEHAYKFIPENDGIYNFQLSGSSNFELLVYNRHGNCMTEQSGMIINAQPTLTKGETYYIKISSTYHEPEEDFKADYTFNITVPSAVTSLEIICDTESIYPSNNIYLHPVFTPDNSIIESIDWTIEDTEIASLNGQYPDGSIAIYCKKPGTTTVTATSRNGLTATYTLTVKNYDSLTLDTPYTHTIEPYETKFYAFTPSETGVYEVCLDRSGFMPFSFSITDTNYNSLNHIHSYSFDEEFTQTNKTQYQLEKDKTYYVRVNAEVPMTYTVSITKPVKATSIVLSFETITDLVGKSYGIFRTFGPENSAYENTVWSIDDESIAKISYNPDDCGGRFLNVTFLKAGTATITAISESGLTATCTITVIQPEEIFVDTAKSSSITNQNRLVTYAFVPQEDGAYKFSLNDSAYNQNYFYLYLSDIHGNHLISEYNQYIEAQAILEKGKTYYVEISCDRELPEDITADYSINITIPQKATSMKISSDKKSVYQGDYIRLYPDFMPYGAAIENVEWFLEDNNVAYIDSFNWDGSISLYCTSSGTITVTATSESGFTASYTLTVKSYSDATTLKLNEENIVPTDIKNSIFQFTPDESGTYAFYSTGTVQADANLYDSELNHLKYDSYSGDDYNFYLYYDLNAGETYYLSCGIQNCYEEAKNYTVFVKKIVPATSIRILNGNSIEGYVNNYVALYVAFNSTNVIKENFTWSVEDESIAYVDGWYENGGVSIRLNNPGSTTITVTSERGLSDSIKITVKENIKPEGMKIFLDGSSTKYVGTSLWLYARFNPISFSEKVYWTSSNPDVVEITSEEYSACQTYCKKVGTATITATSESGLTASCVITVINAEEIELNTTKKVKIFNSNDSAYFSFTPEESGYYTFYSISPYDTVGSIYNVENNDDCGTNKNFRVNGYMISGNTYLLEAGIYTGSANEFDVRLERLDVDTSNGDINFDGEVNALDIAWMRKLMLDIIPLDSASRDIYDINFDGSLDIRDLVRLKTLIAKSN